MLALAFLQQREARRRTAPPTVRRFSFYDVLEVDADASQAECKAAYLRLAKRYHPDANPDESAATKFKAVSEAWETVGDPEKRARFDERLQSGVRGGGGDAWAKQRRDARRNAFGSDSRKLTQMERLLGPRGLGAAAAALALVLFFGSGARAPAVDESLVRDCWINPRTRRVEPPAPWDPDYKKAKAAGQTRTVKRSELG
ncbi:hypothetical protein JL720_3644 [Aureococcus anophagefferens]|nr:hypothetical protein JL720_3644 [Aureococcus anophagefferens]